MNKPVIIAIVDGLGLSNETVGNAFAQANTPFLDKLKKEYPYTKLGAAGAAVGLPEGQIGNSEVGHLNIGAGEIVYTGLTLIQKAIDDKSFRNNDAFLKSIKHAKENNSTLQVIGLLSPGGVHSLEEHLLELIETAHIHGVKDLTLHAFGDGRDVGQKSITPSIEKVIKSLDKYGYKLGSIAGRLYGMDRDENFDKTELSFETIKGNSKNTFDDPIKFINSEYEEGRFDEFLTPTINSDKSVKFLKSDDAVIFFNFRPDRARQLAHLLINSSLYKYKAKHPIENVQLTTMMGYEGIDSDIAFDSMEVQNPIGKVISKAGLKQLRIAETQKYAHVTFFMDGGKDIELKGADRILVPSPKVDDFSKAPKMSAVEITDKLLPVINDYDLTILNFANPDMVGHTGNLEATIIAVETIDEQLSKIYSKLQEANGTMFITADHGNAEIMLDDNGVVTKHTTSHVPLYITDKDVSLKEVEGSLANVAPTVLSYIGIPLPTSMTHKTLTK